MASTKDIFRAASIFAVLAAGSCAAPDGTPIGNDPIPNHPITVEPSYHKLRLPFSVSESGLMPDDAQRFSDFVEGYVYHGNGAISISAPAGHDSDAAIAYFGERLADAGVPRDRILVGTRQVSDGDARVELGYISYQATASACGNWSTDLSFTPDNTMAPNFGCANQHNVAAEVADPRDLIAPHPAGPSEASRRATVWQNYVKGAPTGATISPDQSVAASDVSK
jgi:pilus assembly protein CpaD